MKKSDSLVGGFFGDVTARRSARGRSAADEPQAPQVGYRFLGTLVLIGALFTSAAAWRVHTVFETRDLEMEAGRLQDLMQKKRDRTKTLMARVAHLQQGDILKATAEASLGMAEPLPGAMETVVVTQEMQNRWHEAAESTRAAAPEVSME